MNSDSVFKAIEEIATVSSKNDKQARVLADIGDETFLRVLKAALDPLVTFAMP
jgi:DNA ligase-1